MTAAVLLPYQRRWYTDDSPIKVIVKSRRIGISWTSACRAVDDASTNASDTYYISYSEDQAVTFVRDVATWASHWALAFLESTTLIDDIDDNGESRKMKAYQVEFANGRRVLALSGRPRSLRGKPGNIIIDEFAFCDSPAELLKAAIAAKIWGGRISIISTHDGAENPFNKLVEGIESGAIPYSLHKVNLDDAIADGLYSRIAEVTGQPDTAEACDRWRAELIAEYGADADEELFAIPKRDSAAFFVRDRIRIVDRLPDWSTTRAVRGWDFAATVPRRNADPDWTEGAKGIVMLNRATKETMSIVVDLVSLQGKPAQVKSLLKATAELDGPSCTQAIWMDPGAAGIYMADDMAAHLKPFRCTVERAARSKVEYARAPAHAMCPAPVDGVDQEPTLFLLRGPWNERMIAQLAAFPSKHAHDDIVDALSRMHIALSTPAFEAGYSASDKRAEHGDIWALESPASSCF